MTTITKRTTAPDRTHPEMIGAMLMSDLNDMPDDTEVNQEQFEEALSSSNVISINYYKNSNAADEAISEGLSQDATFAPEFLNDAKLRGVSTPAFEKLLERPITLFVGAHGKLTDWNIVSKSFKALIIGGPDWGFSVHRETRRKGGFCFVPAEFTGTKRNVDAVRTLHCVGLDFDSGTKRADVEKKIADLGIAAIVYTSFSDQKAVSHIKRTALFKDMPHIDGEPTTAHVQEYLRDYARAIYTEEHITSVEVIDANHATNEGMVVQYSHAPLDKFRVVIPFPESVDVESIHRELQPRKNEWANKVVGAAYLLLGGHPDLACVDMARVFYMPEHPKGASPSITIFQGDPLAYEDVPSLDKDEYRGMFKPKVAAHKADGLIMPSGTPWTVWAAQNADRLQLATLIDTEFPDMVRRSKGDLLEIECPNEEYHSTPGGTGTHVIDADGMGGGFRFGCKHSCPDDRLVLLAALAQNQNFDENWLWEDHDNGGYLWPEGEEEPEAEKARIEVKKECARSFEEQAAQFDKMASQEDIENFFEKMLLEGVDVVVQANVSAIIVQNTNLGKRELNKIWKFLKEAARRTERMATGAGIDLGEGGYRDHCNKVADTMTDQGEQPTIFQSNGRLAEIRTDEQNALRIENIDKDRYKARIEDRMDFFKDGGSVEAPHGIVNNVFHRDRSGMPPLHKIIRAPAFDPEMRLITEPGYHESGVFYQPQEGVVIPVVSLKPTSAEVRKAVDDLADVMGDFMLDAMPRMDLLAAVRDGTPVPSFCSALSVGLTAMCRAFIDGPTPGHLARKMLPRTGATKLLSNVSYMATLSHARPQSLPDKKDEVQKTLVSNFDAGLQFVFFDNLPDSGKVDFGELASAMTAYPNYAGRRLGQTAMIDVKVDTTFMFTGNKTVLSPELAARVLLIVLDPQVERPEDRTGFKYNIDAHVAAHGGKYLHAFMTLVQHWIATGCKEWTGKALGGFERHSAIIGGILESAGIMGFLGNREVLRSTVNTSTPEDDLMDALIEMYNATPPSKDGTLFRVWGADAPPRWVGNGVDREKHDLAGHRVVSVKEVLEAESIAISGAGYAQTQDGAIIYPDRAKPRLMQTIGAMVGTVRELGPDREEETRKQGRYILKTAHRDKHSNMYKLERLELTK